MTVSFPTQSPRYLRYEIHEVLSLLAQIAEGMGNGRMWSPSVLAMPEKVCLAVLAVQEQRRLERAGSAWLEVIRPDQVRNGGAGLKSARWVCCSICSLVCLETSLNTSVGLNFL